ncbi:class I SAM-dependent DNA methyltransferase [Pedobacter montanisoli]|uniref:site-specific DNA-methyltransferase (adenine-specific) n=1 Tax=Pedobacter montanisoli TaxID=2923277 RepID=A0ABS9ZZ99_9SPHI|nr:class I SAM-dependent DNA methyltransferase [Pedobacter montanisoli]MCJ0743633.1 type I restriction-modification system subunit M [Pedobacter montanisoli]
MLNSIIKTKISNLWDMFWAAGTSNPLTALEQISYLLFMRRAEDVGLVEEDSYKWSFYTQCADIDLPKTMSDIFEHLKTINNEHEPFTKAMEGAKFEITKPSLLRAAIDVINDIYEAAEQERNEGQIFQDTLGDFYELILSQTGEAGKNGQFRTPRHIIHFMCELLKPTLEDKICDVTCGTSGFLVGAYQYIISQNSGKEEWQTDTDGFKIRTSANAIKPNSKKAKKLTTGTFYGYDIDTTMIRLGMMNLMMHNIKEPHIKHIDSLSQKFDEEEGNTQYTKILANPPFTGRIDSLDISMILDRVYPPKFDKDGKRQKQNIQSELLFLERIIQLLEIEGKAAVVVPEGVLFGGSNAYKNLREILLKDCLVDAIISLPSGAFKPYTGVKTSILVFTKKGFKNKDFSTQKVWFYELETDGYSLDDNRKKLSDNPLPRAVEFYDNKIDDEAKKERRQHFYVPFGEIEKNDFDLSFNRYKDFDYEEQQYDPPQEILKAILALEVEINNDLQELKDLIGYDEKD